MLGAVYLGGDKIKVTPEVVTVQDNEDQRENSITSGEKTMELVGILSDNMNPDPIYKFADQIR